jgi:hypothetical protein
VSPFFALTIPDVPYMFCLDKEGTDFMEAFDVAEINTAVALPVLATGDSGPDAEAIRLRALRRKARRISAYARFNVESLINLAVAVETDIAALQD